MKAIEEMTMGELAAFICTHLESKDIECVLSGGACVSIFSENKYFSYDLDFIETSYIERKKLSAAMLEIGYKENNRYYKHHGSEFFVEFPPGPLSVGSEPVQEILSIKYLTGKLKIISPTECVKDRLAAFYFWDDLQSLEQALMVAQNNKIDLKEVERWSKVENKSDMFVKFKKRL